MLGAVLFVCPTLFAAQAAAANSPALAEVTFHYERPGVPVPRFTLRVREDGTGNYQADQAATSSSDTAMRGQAAQHIDRPLTVSPAMAAKIFTAARGADRFNTVCASKAKNIADTGAKTLSYTGADGSGSCVFNYTENKTASMLTDVFLGIASTMDEGRKLEFLHRYDRLGLDAEMNFLSQEVAAGRALELGTISSTLSAIAEDPELMQRVRLRASRMLEQSQSR
jgi:hypothetical protein